MGGDGFNNYTSRLDSNINVIKLETIGLSNKEGWFKLGEKLICLRFNKGSSEIIVISENNTIENTYIIPGYPDCSVDSIKVGGIDICNEIASILQNYQRLLLEYEITEKAKALKVLNYQAIPDLPDKWSLLLYSLTQKLLSSKIIKTFYIIDGSREVILGIYCYENGVYVECEDKLKSDLQNKIADSRLLDIKLSPVLAGLVVRNIEFRTLTPYRPAKHKLLFKNKVFDWDIFVETGDLESALFDPSPDLVVIHRIPWELKKDVLKVREGILKYIPPQSVEDLIELFKQLAPRSYKAFMDWVKKPDEPEEKAYSRIVLLLEIIGYTLYPHDYPFHKSILLVGSGSNGKSTYLRLIETILSKANISSVNLSDLDPRYNRFASSDLYGKLANLSSEPVKRDFDPTLFKMLTGEDLVRIERKFRDSFTFHNYAKLIFSANELPAITEDTYAFWRRWIVIEFPNQFPPDPEFFSRTFTEEEIENIIILSLYSFRLVLIRKSFSESGVDIKDEWMSRSNPIYPVIKRMVEEGIIEFDPNGLVVKKDLYALYQYFASKMRDDGYDVDIVTPRDFTIRLAKFFNIRSREKRIGGKQKHCYFGVRIKDYSKAKEIIPDLETPPNLTLAT